MVEAVAAEPLVSVLIPAFNAQMTIGETLQSARVQTYPFLEILVVDDGSTDRTAAIVEAVVCADPRVGLVRQRNQGVAHARNRALSLARGELIAPLDADDLWHPTKIARQVEVLRRSKPGTGFVYCWSADIDEASNVVEQRLDLDRYEGDVFVPLVATNFLGNSSVPLVKRRLLEAIGGWDSTLRDRGAQGAEDWLLYLHLAHRCELALTPEFLVGYRQHAGSISRDVAQMRRSFLAVLEEARHLRPDLPSNLFRWSQGAFDIYRASILHTNGRPISGTLALLSGIGRDPVWLTRRSTRRIIRRWISRARQSLPMRGKERDQVSLVPFEQMRPEEPIAISEGRWLRRRRRFLESFQPRALVEIGEQPSSDSRLLAASTEVRCEE